MQISRLVAKPECFKDSLKDEDVARDPQNALLLVPVLLRRFIQQIDEDRVVKKLGAHDEPLHLLSDVDREVAVGDSTGAEGTAELGRAEALGAAGAGGGSGVGSEEAVL